MGLIDGAAPPFIMLALTAAIMAALLTFSSYAAGRADLLAGTQKVLFVYSLSTVILAALVIVRITARGLMQTAARPLDMSILLITAWVLSAFGVLSLFAWRHAQETAQ